MSNPHDTLSSILAGEKNQMHMGKEAVVMSREDFDQMQGLINKLRKDPRLSDMREWMAQQPGKSWQTTINDIEAYLAELSLEMSVKGNAPNASV